MFNNNIFQVTIACEFGVKNKKLRMTISGRKYNPGKKPSSKKATPAKQKATQKKSTADQPTSPEAEITEIHGDNEQTQQDTDDELLYGSEDSLPDPFMLQDPKKIKTSKKTKIKRRQKPPAQQQWTKKCQNSFLMMNYHCRSSLHSRNLAQNHPTNNLLRLQIFFLFTFDLKIHVAKYILFLKTAMTFL